MVAKFIASSKRHPCPVCDRTKDGDCRSLEADNLVLCHSYLQADSEGESRGYRFLHATKDGLWGTWIYQQAGADGKTKGRKAVRSGPARQRYIYTDRQGQNLVMVVRIQREGGKTFSQYRWDGVEWVSKLNEYAKNHVPIYRYQQVRDAIAQGKTIFMVEGEGCADALWELGIPATTTLGGSKKYRAFGRYFEDLKGATLVLCPDRDKVGIEHMEDIARDFPNAKWCYVLPDSPLWKHLPDVGGLDIADWIAEGATAEEIANAITDKRDFNAKPAEKITKADLIQRVKKLESIESPVDRLFEQWDLTRLSGRGHRELLELAIALKSDLDLSDDEWAPTAKVFAEKQLLVDEWLFKGFLKAGRVTLVGAESKTGKSLLHYDWSYCLATGGAWGEFPSSNSHPVIIVQTDEPETDCQERLKIRGLSELENCRVITKFMPQHLPRLRNLMTSLGREGLIVLDSLTSINRFSGFSPKDPEYAYFVYELKDLASELGWGVILICHTNKSPLDLGIEKLAGSYAIAAACSDILLLYRVPNAPDGDTARLLRRLGGRNGPPKTWKIELNLEDYSYDYIGECDKNGNELSEGEPSKLRASGRQRVLNFLQANAPTAYEVREIAEYLQMNLDRCRSLCGEMFRDKLVLRKGSQGGKANRTKAYYLPSPFGTVTDQCHMFDRVEGGDRTPDRTAGSSPDANPGSVRSGNSENSGNFSEREDFWGDQDRA